MNKHALWWDFDPTIDRGQYVQDVLDRYCRTPTCAGRVRREDRRLAYRLYDQRIPPIIVHAAFILGAMRRLYRLEAVEDCPCGNEQLTPVRSLHYFLPIIDEIRRQAIDPDYITCAEWKVRNADRQLERIRKLREQPSAC
jgi:hypothetical protein